MLINTQRFIYKSFSIKFYQSSMPKISIKLTIFNVGKYNSISKEFILNIFPDVLNAIFVGKTFQGS